MRGPQDSLKGSIGTSGVWIKGQGLRFSQNRGSGEKGLASLCSGLYKNCPKRLPCVLGELCDKEQQNLQIRAKTAGKVGA